MRPVLLPVLIGIALLCPVARPLTAQAMNWRQKVAAELPMLGHRNWILVVDAAYPLQVAPGIETVETNAPMLEVVGSVLDQIGRSQHLRPAILLDAELAHVPESEASGIGGYRTQLHDLIKDLSPLRMPHEKILATLNHEGEQFHILILKTNATLPYSSVFIRLDCRYWSDDAEIQLRSVMSQARP
jgi:hypothetical protein